MLLWAVHKLRYSSRKPLRDYEVLATERMLADEEAENFDQMRVQRHFLNGEIVH